MPATPKYKTLRLREEDYEKLKEVQRLLRQKGTDGIDWEELRGQDVVDVPEEDDEGEEDDGSFTWGFVVGLGAAALAALIIKHVQEQNREEHQA